MAAAVQARPRALRESLKTAPRGYPRDHPPDRAAAPQVADRGPCADGRGRHRPRRRARARRRAWRAAEPLNAWLDAHVGPSTLPREPRGGAAERTGTRTPVREMPLMSTPASRHPAGSSPPLSTSEVSPMRKPALLAAAVAMLAVALPSTALAHPRRQGVQAGRVRRPERHHHRPRRRPLRRPTAASTGCGASPRRARSPRSSSKAARPASPPVATARCGSATATSSRIQRVTTAARSRPTPAHRGRLPTDIVSGPDGALWFTETRGDKIGRITTKGQITEYPIPTPDAFAADIAVGPDGALWFTESDGNKIGRITTSGELTEFPLEDARQPPARSSAAATARSTSPRPTRTSSRA